MAVGLILLIDYTLPGNLLFGTAPIPLRAWLVVLPFALLMLGLEEFRKWLVRRKTGDVRPRSATIGEDGSVGAAGCLRHAGRPGHASKVPSP